MVVAELDRFVEHGIEIEERIAVGHDIELSRLDETDASRIACSRRARAECADPRPDPRRAPGSARPRCSRARSSSSRLSRLPSTRRSGGGTDRKTLALRPVVSTSAEPPSSRTYTLRGPGHSIAATAFRVRSMTESGSPQTGTKMSVLGGCPTGRPSGGL